MVTPPWTAEHVVTEALANELVHEQFGELAGVRLERIGEGWDNTVFRGGPWVFRFPRRSIAVPLIETEARVLPSLAPLLPLRIPVPAFVGRPTSAYPWPFVGYGFVPGLTACRAGLGGSHRAAAAPVLGAFLRALHDVDPSLLALPGDELARADARSQAPELHTRIDALAERGLVTEVDALHRLAEPSRCRPPTDAPRVVHGDLYGRHLVMDDTRRLVAVIDWGDVHVGDPAVDLAIAFGFLPPEARPAFFAAYGPVDPATCALARFRALRSAIAILWYGHDTRDTELAREGRVALAHLLDRATPVDSRLP